MTRQELGLSAIDRTGRGLEIGPSYNPLAPKKEGFFVDIVDHLDQSGLIKKYENHPVDIGKIEPVDFVWQGGSLLDLIQRTAYYDYIIASHVVEHLPNLLGFLQDLEQLLKPDGVLALVIPDKRYCFDYLKPVTTTGAILDAALQPRAVHSPGVIFDHQTLSVALDCNIAWGAGSSGELGLVHDFSEARSLLEATGLGDGIYRDVHRWHFTPSSFKLNLLDLQAIGRLHFDVVAEHETVGCEFYVSLKKVALLKLPPDWKVKRLDLAKRILAEQSSALIKGELPQQPGTMPHTMHFTSQLRNHGRTLITALVDKTHRRSKPLLSFFGLRFK